MSHTHTPPSPPWALSQPLTQPYTGRSVAFIAQPMPTNGSLEYRLDTATTTGVEDPNPSTSSSISISSSSTSSTSMLGKPDPAQIAAISSDAPAVLLVAGAGTGKTRVLAARLAHVLRTDLVRPPFRLPSPPLPPRSSCLGICARASGISK